jgi:hypothetical protein
LRLSGANYSRHYSPGYQDYRGNYATSALIATITKLLRSTFGEALMVRRRSSTVQKPMLPGEAVMLGTLAKRRSTLRLPTRRIAWLTFQTLPKHERVALVKDISERGIYFYSDFDPDIGDQLEFVVEYLSGSEKVRLHLKGKVVRVEKAGAGSACGVAISFYSHLDWTSPTPV